MTQKTGVLVCLLEERNELSERLLKYFDGNEFLTKLEVSEIAQKIKEFDEKIDVCLEKRLLEDFAPEGQLDFAKKLPVKIRKKRKELGFSIRKVSELSNISTTTYQAIEKGSKSVNLHILLKCFLF